MAVRIRIKSGPDEGRDYEFQDDDERIVVGRNPERCHVCLPPDLTVVGREHFALRRQLGRYRLILNETNPVLVDGRPALDGMELPLFAELTLGEGGPVLVVETLLPEGLPQTMWRGKLPQTPRAVMEQAAKRTAANRRLVWVTLAAVLVAAAGLVWALVDSEQRREDEQRRAETERERLLSTLKGLEGKLDAVRAASAADRKSAQEELDTRLAGVQGALDALRPDVLGLRKAMAGLGPRMEGLERRVEDLRPRLREHLRKAQGSVLLVLMRNRQGDEKPLATAWVAADKTLATNAHVAAAFHQLPPGNELIARTSGEAPKDFKITSVQEHPGYTAFQNLWETHAPTRVQLGGGLQRLNQVPSCDVATMKVEGDAKLGPPLELASIDVLQAIGPGDVVGFLGFPLEDMAGGAVNLKAPSPTIQVGHITGVTNFFLGRTQPRNALLVQHSMTTVGGTSGSPVIDARGRVIAIHNAGNFIFVGGKRVPGADVNFAQRVDLLKELLDGTAGTSQDDRTRTWEQGIAQFQSLRAAARRVAADYLDARLKRIKEELKLEPELLLQETAMLQARGGGVSTFEKPYALAKPGWYVFFAWSTTAENIDILLLKPKEDVILLKEVEPNPFPLLPANADKPQDIRVVVGAGSRRIQHGEFELRIYHFPEPEKKPAPDAGTPDKPGG